MRLTYTRTSNWHCMCTTWADRTAGKDKSTAIWKEMSTMRVSRMTTTSSSPGSSWQRACHTSYSTRRWWTQFITRDSSRISKILNAASKYNSTWCLQLWASLSCLSLMYWWNLRSSSTSWCCPSTIAVPKLRTRISSSLLESGSTIKLKGFTKPYSVWTRTRSTLSRNRRSTRNFYSKTFSWFCLTCSFTCTGLMLTTQMTKTPK